MGRTLLSASFDFDFVLILNHKYLRESHLVFAIKNAALKPRAFKSFVIPNRAESP